MTDEDTAALVKSMIREKSPEYFASHSLAGLLVGAGMESAPGVVGALLRRLASEDVYAFLDAISSGLHDAATDSDGFAKTVSVVASKIRHGVFQGMVPDALIKIGKERPGEAAGIAKRLIGRGDADFAAYLIGGAYGGAQPACDGMVESLLASGNPAEAAAAACALRVAGAKHGLPLAGRIKPAAQYALAHGDAAAQREAMEALLDICGKGDEEVDCMIGQAAARHPASRPALAGRIYRKPPFGDEQSLRYLEVCAGYGADTDTIYAVYWALADIASREPGGAARLLFRLFSDGKRHDVLAGRVIDVLGKRDAPATILRLLDMMRRRHHSMPDRSERQIMKRLLKHADLTGVADALFRYMSERQGSLDACLSILGMLVVESHLRGRGAEFAAGVTPRIIEHAADAGDDLGNIFEEEYNTSMGCTYLIDRIMDGRAEGRRPPLQRMMAIGRAEGRRPPLQRIGVIGRTEGRSEGIAYTYAAPGKRPGVALPGVRWS